jgi:hypothetical protein
VDTNGNSFFWIWEKLEVYNTVESVEVVENRVE